MLVLRREPAAPQCGAPGQSLPTPLPVKRLPKESTVCAESYARRRVMGGPQGGGTHDGESWRGTCDGPREPDSCALQLQGVQIMKCIRN